MTAAHSTWADVGKLVLRLGIGAAFAVHGWPKITQQGMTWAQIGSAMPLPGATFWGFMAAFAEFGGGILFAAGLLTRLVCAMLVINMAVAVKFHLQSPPPMNTFAMWSHAFEDGVVFLGMLFIGPGRLSLDHLLFNRRRREELPVSQSQYQSQR